MNLTKIVDAIDLKKFLIICGALVILGIFGTVSFSIGSFNMTTNIKNSVVKGVNATYEHVEEKRDLLEALEKEQLIILESKFAIMRDEFLRTHRELLISKGYIDVFNNPQYKAYSHIIEIGFNQMRFLALNDFNEMMTIFTKPDNVEFSFQFIKAEFLEYVGALTPDGLTGLKSELINEFGRIVQLEWVNIGIVSAEENFEWTRKIVPRTCELIHEVYEEAVKKQLYYQKVLKIKRDEFDRLIKSLN